jgi:general secretion pathway protein M
MALKFGSLSLERFKIANLTSAYFGMSPREQTASLVGAAVVLVLVIVLPIAIASGRIGKLEKEVAQGRTQQKEIIRAIEGYSEKKAQLMQLQQTLAGGFDSSISTTLESMAEQAGIKDKIDSLKEKAAAPSDLFDEASVDVRLKRLTLQQTIDFLYAIEHNPDKMLRLRQLSIKPRFDNKQELDVAFTVSTYRLLEGATEGV